MNTSFLSYFSDAPAAAAVLLLILAGSFAGFLRPSLRAAWMLDPSRIAHGSPSTLVTFGFIHADAMHLLFNLVSYLSFAFALERTIGTQDFLVVYLGSLVLGTIPVVIRRRNDTRYRALGASGAISGLIFSAMLFFPGGSVSLFLIPIPIPFPLFGVLFLLGSWYGARRSIGNIGHDVHAWGALAGLLLTMALHPGQVSRFLYGVRSAWLS